VAEQGDRITSQTVRFLQILQEQLINKEQRRDKEIQKPIRNLANEETGLHPEEIQFNG
jgi:hypothetical protein